MGRESTFLKNVDWITILLYSLLVFCGWISIYAAVYDDSHSSIVDISQSYGKQLIWIVSSYLIGTIILSIDSKFFTVFSISIYALIMASLIAVLVMGKDVHGARSWFEIGSFRLQPAEFGKFATCLAIAYIMSRFNFSTKKISSFISIGAILLIPICLIILQNDTGSALVYCAFIFVLFREGLHGSFLVLGFIAIVLFIFTLLYEPITVLVIIISFSFLTFLYYRQNSKELTRAIYLLVGIFISLKMLKWLFEDFSFTDTIDNYKMLLVSFIISSVVYVIVVHKKRMKYIIAVIVATYLCIGATQCVDYAFENMLAPHHKDRINNLLGLKTDLSGIGYNVFQSKVAIGSGEFIGKGFLQGTQTKFNFVPEQSTDFIFCTIGEEWGFLGSTFIILVMLSLILRIIYMAERQRSDFSRIYGYGVASILFFHTAVNIGMTIGLVPVIGIPLPFISYGGSSLWSFTILLFIFIRLDSNRLEIFR